MLDSWLVILVALIYLGFLFAVASYGDARALAGKSDRGRPYIYALSLAVYCTSWTFFGSVGLSATTGLDFLPIYIGPIIMIALGVPLLSRITRLAKSQNITSIADFIAARYGKSPALAAIVAIIAVFGTLPYLALQLKAVSQSFTLLQGKTSLTSFAGELPFGDIAFFIALGMAAFSILFGTRHTDATEHQDGLMLAIATESIVKLVAFLTVGFYVVFGMFGGIGPLFEKAAETPFIMQLFTRGFDGGTWLTVMLLSFVGIIILPRQFHVAVVENRSAKDIKTASWLFPLYLIAINLFIVPIAIAGLLTFPDGTVSEDMFVLALPLSDQSKLVTLIAFVGGLSAATAMVIVGSVALSIMVCNDLVIPLILRGRRIGAAKRANFAALLLNIRRTAILGIILLAYLFHKLVGNSAPLASIGLLSFAAIAQFAPAFFGGLVWRSATARGAIAGITGGFAIWCYTLLLPYFINAGWLSPDILQNGPFGMALLRPQVLFNLEFEPLTHGVIWSLFVNIALYIVFSLSRAPRPIERLQASAFIPSDLQVAAVPGLRLRGAGVSVLELKNTAARYIGEKRTNRSFREFEAQQDRMLLPNEQADVQLMRYTETLLASAIGAASSRLVLSLLLRRHNVGRKNALRLLDDASEALYHNRDLLQSALEHVHQGIAVFDKDMQLILWNREFREMLGLPDQLGRVGVPLDEIVRYCANQGQPGERALEDIVAARLNKFVVTMETFQSHIHDGRVIEVRTNSLPHGGIVTTYTDITQREKTADALTKANETLERRVRERTSQLVQVNRELTMAKAKADEANIGKTRFLAAASHDVLQPLNAARLYTSSLVDRATGSEDRTLANNIDASLEAVEEILNALLDISRLDAGAMKPEPGKFALNDLLDSLQLEFAPLAQTKGLELRVIPSSLWVKSDRRLLRRILRNLVSNAVKYTDSGRVLVGVRRGQGNLKVLICDTGVGIPKSKQGLIFQEFQRLGGNAVTKNGIGLGLSIVERIARILGHNIDLSSDKGRGSVFSVTLPVVAPVKVKPEKQDPMRTAPGQGGGCRVMCIDNEPAILDGMVTLLTGWGCTSLTAPGASDAIDVIRSSGIIPDIILADYHLDGETGLEALEKLQKELGIDRPAVIITADHSPEIRNSIKEAGVNILRKPLKPAALRALMAQAHLKRVAAE